MKRQWKNSNMEFRRTTALENRIGEKFNKFDSCVGNEETPFDFKLKTILGKLISLLHVGTTNFHIRNNKIISDKP